MKFKFINLPIVGRYINDLHVLRTKLRKESFPEEIQSSWELAPKDLSDKEFFSWFDTIEDITNLDELAQRDFKHAVLEKATINSEMTVCEIGFGGGRLLKQACQLSKFSYGIDIHHNFKETQSFLNQSGLSNFSLHHFDDRESIKEIDLFYSFIVIQHFQSVDILESYLTLIHKKLRNKGKAVLWYGKLETKLFGDIVEIKPSQFRKRECSLYIHPSKMEKIVNSHNFHILEHYKNNLCSDLRTKSMQNCIVIQKP